MEFNYLRLFVSIGIIALGVFYFVYPEKGPNGFYSKVPTKASKAWIKYSGIIMVILGIYYLLVMAGLLPMLSI